MTAYPERVPYKGRYHQQGISDDQVWSPKNYLLWDDQTDALTLARKPFYIARVVQPRGPDGYTVSEILVIFGVRQVQFVRECFTASSWSKKTWHMEALMRTFDNIDDWPNRAVAGESSRGLYALREATNLMLGPAVVDILRWHGVLTCPGVNVAHPEFLKLDQDALDLWSVAATLIAEADGVAL